MPDTPIYRVGPQPGGPLYVPDTLNNREGRKPYKARKPYKGLNGRSYGETGQRGLLIAASYKRLNKTLIGP